MPYHATWETRGVYVDYVGETSDTELARLARCVQGDPRYDDLRWLFHDFRECTGTTFSPRNIKMLAATDAAAALSNPRMKVAAVADMQDVIEMLTTYQDTRFGASALREPPLRVFAAVDDARAWLGMNASA